MKTRAQDSQNRPLSLHPYSSSTHCQADLELSRTQMQGGPGLGSGPSGFSLRSPGTSVRTQEQAEGAVSKPVPPWAEEEPGLAELHGRASVVPVGGRP